MKIYECQRSRSFFWPLSKVTQILTVSSLFLWRYWAKSSQISFGASNKDSFKQFGSHDQDGGHAHHMVKPLIKSFFLGIDQQMLLKLGFQHQAFGYYVQRFPNDDPKLIFDLFTKGQLWLLMHLYGKMFKWWKNSETIGVYVIKVHRSFRMKLDLRWATIGPLGFFVLFFTVHVHIVDPFLWLIGNMKLPVSTKADFNK